MPGKLAKYRAFYGFLPENSFENLLIIDDSKELQRIGLNRVYNYDKGSICNIVPEGFGKGFQSPWLLLFP